ncbi:hypothetical protein KIPB_002049 [Kipferlia bialata]|uniref:Uncharacterized protein n=1 Tax=Kipferlia bialata TaxID=797122 RepID=A0A9K3CRM7_9EUKA|nr:hypothetical protein KIPB_002049 [Kipferlia bialata]|eukprot:g2049.t1
MFYNYLTQAHEGIVDNVLSSFALLAASHLAQPVFDLGVLEAARKAMADFPGIVSFAETMCELVAVFTETDALRRASAISNGYTQTVLDALTVWGTEGYGSTVAELGLSALSTLALEASHVQTMVDMGVLDTVESSLPCADHG